MTTAVAKRNIVIGRGESRLGHWQYGNSWAGKFQPDVSGYTDCSGFTKWAHSPYHTLGKMSYDQATEGIEVASGTTVAQFLAIAHLIKPADVTAMALESGYRNGISINHVELNTGGVLSLGHGSGIGPQRHNLTASWLLGDARRWTIRRFIPDDKTTPAKKPLTDLEKEIATMKAMYVIFQHKGSICVSSEFNNQWSKFPNPTIYKLWLAVKKRNGATVMERKSFPGCASNVVKNPSAFGVYVPWKVI